MNMRKHVNVEVPLLLLALLGFVLLVIVYAAMLCLPLQCGQLLVANWRTAYGHFLDEAFDGWVL